MDHKKLKILCLHGYGQNKTIFREKLGQFRKNLKQYAEFSFIDAPHLVVNPDSIAVEANCEKVEERSWWFTSPDHTYQSKIKTDFCAGLEDSLSLIQKTFSEEGPFDGILGFSQGAAFTAIICSQIEKNLISLKLNFVIIVAGFKSLFDGHIDLYTTPLNVQTLHVIGETDEVIHPDRSKALFSVFKNGKLLMHSGGHYVPASKDLKEKYIEFLSAIKEQ